MGVDTALKGVPSFENLQVIKTGTDIIPAVGIFDHSTLFVAHNLGFKPLVMAYTSYQNSITPIPGSPTGISIQGGDDIVRFTTWVTLDITDTDLIFQHWNSSEVSGYNQVRIKYYLLRSLAS